MEGVLEEFVCYTYCFWRNLCICIEECGTSTRCNTFWAQRKDLVAQPQGRPNQRACRPEKQVVLADEKFVGRHANLKKMPTFATKKLSRNFRREIFAAIKRKTQSNI